MKAAKTVVITAERIIDSDAFRAAPERTSIPGYAVDHVIQAPRGAWPTACCPEYPYDADFYRSYQAAARNPEAFAALFAEHVGPLPERTAIG